MAVVKRLIDARYLTSQMYLICEACQTDNIFIDAIIDEIDNAPDVDAVEVVHGEWIAVRDKKFGGSLGLQCSVCRRRTRNKGGNYCPNCGAKMDEERK